MSADVYLKGAVVVASLVFLLLMFAPTAGAADQPMGPGTQAISWLAPYPTGCP
jgi:hypothetical protein